LLLPVWFTVRLSVENMENKCVVKINWFCYKALENASVFIGESSPTTTKVPGKNHFQHEKLILGVTTSRNFSFFFFHRVYDQEFVRLKFKT
jgi:hypothetical protein